MTVTPTRQQRQRARAIRRQLRRAHRRPLTLRVRELLGQGQTPEQVADALAPMIDALLPLAALGPIGVVAEVLDGPVAWFLVRLIAAELTRSRPTTSSASAG